MIVFSKFISPRGTMGFYVYVQVILALIHVAVTNSRVAPIFLPCPRGCSYETRCTALGCLLCQPNYCHHLVTRPLRVLCVENCPAGYRCSNVSIENNTKRFCLT